MAAPRGNTYWTIRTKHGRDKLYKTPAAFLKACNEYFSWCQENPLYEAVVQKRKISRDEEKIEIVKVPKMRAYTIEGLCNYLDMSVQTFHEYGKAEDFSEIVTRVRQIIYNQKFEGAASGFLNPNIIARDLGLVDKSASKVTYTEQPLFDDGDDESED